MPYCPNCGSKVSAKASFCSDCGEKLYPIGEYFDQGAQNVSEESPKEEQPNVADLVDAVARYKIKSETKHPKVQPAPTPKVKPMIYTTAKPASFASSTAATATNAKTTAAPSSTTSQPKTAKANGQCPPQHKFYVFLTIFVSMWTSWWFIMLAIPFLFWISKVKTDYEAGNVVSAWNTSRRIKKTCNWFFWIMLIVDIIDLL